ncbi:MAG TPA: hypothetical protein PKE45_24625, partial [Caldilineaceae bacterium]|nr:hypothetical protein [Caldilineaceae bacterium]
MGYEGKHYADLIVAVDNANLAGPIFGAGLVEVVDLTLNLEESVDSEYTQVRSQVEHVLAPQGLALSEVQAEELDFLAGATELDRDRVRWLVASEKAAQTTSIPASVFYGLFQQTLVDDLSALLRQDGTRWRHALLSAIDDNIIPSSLRDQLGTILAEQFPAQRVEELLRPAQDGHAASLGDLLAVMPNPLSDLQRHTLVKLLDQATDYGDQFWSAMRAEGFEDFQIGRIQATLLLGTLTQNHPSLIHLLHRRFEFTSPADLRQLVWLS